MIVMSYSCIFCISCSCEIHGDWIAEDLRCTADRAPILLWTVHYFKELKELIKEFN
jgi:hypothetical protein